MNSVLDAQRLGVNITTIVDAILKDFEWSGEAVITQYNHKNSHRLPTGHRNALLLLVANRWSKTVVNGFAKKQSSYDVVVM